MTEFYLCPETGFSKNVPYVKPDIPKLLNGRKRRQCVRRIFKSYGIPEKYKDRSNENTLLDPGDFNEPLDFNDPEFITILGAELHSGSTENGEIWHILAVGLPKDFSPTNSPNFLPTDNQETGPEIAKRCVEAGAFVTIAHPQWSGLTLSDARSIKSAHAVEVYNHGCAVSTDRPDGFHTLDLLLAEGRKLNLVATDDAHFTAVSYTHLTLPTNREV